MQFELTDKHIDATIDLTINHYCAIYSLIAMALLPVVAFALHYDNLDKAIKFIIIWCLFYVLVLVPLYLARKRSFRKSIAENVEHTKPIGCEMVGGELQLRSEKTTTLIPRDRIIKITKNETVTLIYKSRYYFHVIPTEFINKNESIRSFLYNAHG